MADWPPPKRVAVFTSISVSSGMGEYTGSTVERREGLCPHFVVHFHTRLLGLKVSNPWLIDVCRSSVGCQAGLPGAGVRGLWT